MNFDNIMDGKALAARRSHIIQDRVKTFQQKYNIVPGLAVVLIGNDPASEIYVRNKIKQAEAAGIIVRPYILPNNISEQVLIRLIDDLNNLVSIHGILVQLPLPSHINSYSVTNRINSAKDIDGFSDISVGKLNIGTSNSGLISCTPFGCLNLLKNYEPNLVGKHAVIVGRSNIVGKPLAALLLQENCTVTICHSHTKNLKSFTQQADIFVSAIGKPRFFNADFFKPGVIVIDVGINRITVDDKVKLVGDVDFPLVSPIAKFITPVPGGVGPMTIISVLENTLLAAERLMDTKSSEQTTIHN